MGVLAEAKHEWKLFREDRPGERFSNHRQRMRDRPRGHSVIAVGAGAMLVVTGSVLLFIPGPGSPLIVFGFGLIASHSKRMSALLDRAEPKLRRAARKTKRTWDALPKRSKLGMIVGAASLGAASLLFMWKFVVAAYLLD